MALTDKQIIKAIEQSRGLMAVAARRLGCSRQTLYSRRDKSPAIRQAIEDARDLTTDLAENALYQAIQEGEAWAVCFYLKTIGRERGYTERQQIEHSGEVSVPALTVVVKGADP